MRFHAVHRGTGEGETRFEAADLVLIERHVDHVQVGFELIETPGTDERRSDTRTAVNPGWIRANYSETLRIESLAQWVSRSVTTAPPSFAGNTAAFIASLPAATPFA